MAVLAGRDRNGPIRLEFAPVLPEADRDADRYVVSVTREDQPPLWSREYSVAGWIDGPAQLWLIARTFARIGELAGATIPFSPWGFGAASRVAKVHVCADWIEVIAHANARRGEAIARVFLEVSDDMATCVRYQVRSSISDAEGFGATMEREILAASPRWAAGFLEAGTHAEDRNEMVEPTEVGSVASAEPGTPVPAGSCSIVMSGFEGRWTDFAKASRRAFGRQGLDVFSLTLSREPHLPCEIADGLPWDDAERIAAQLQESGAEMAVVRTDAVAGVLHRAAEVWPTRTAGGIPFTEIDGMVLGEAPLNARENLEYARGHGIFQSPSHYERLANHEHADSSLPARERVRQEVAMAAELEGALREAYPGRRFVLSHLPGYAVSFYQWAEGVEVEAAVPVEPSNGKAWCQRCQRSRPYTTHEGPDAEFPRAEWGTCTECGDDVLVRAWEITWIIGG